MQDDLFVFLVVFGASPIQGATGFGFAMIVMALLPLVLPLKSTAALTAMCVCSTGAMLSWRLRKKINFKLVSIPILAAVLAVPGGVFYSCRHR
jgi:uncharacterized membrane protein YfcA